jgi:hypothetical protein
MKKLYTIIAAFMLTSVAYTQAPEKMNFQAVIRDASNVLAANQLVGLRISILQGSTAGTAVYEETQTATTNINGLVTLEIGTGTVASGSLSSVDWGVDTYFIKTEADPTGGINYTITGVSQLMSVPYAFHANSVENDMDQQTLTLNEGTGELSISGGNSIVLPKGEDDWGTQSVTTDGTLSGNGTANQILSVVGDLTDDQTLTFNNSNGDLTISGGNTIKLPTTSGGDNWGTQTVSTDATLTGNGSSGDPLKVAEGAFTDNQTLSLSGTDLSITGGNTISLNNANYWTKNNNSNLSTNKKVGINVADPIYPLDIYWGGTSGGDNATRTVNIITDAQTTGGTYLNTGVFSLLNTNLASGRSIWGAASGTSFGIGVVGESNTENDGTGVAGYALSSPTDNTRKTGISAQARGAWDGSGAGTGEHVGLYTRTEGAGVNIGAEMNAISSLSNGATQLGIKSFASGQGTGEHVGLFTYTEGAGVNTGAEMNATSSLSNEARQFGIKSFARGQGTGEHVGLFTYTEGAGENTGAEMNATSSLSNEATQLGIKSFAKGQGTGLHIGIYGTAFGGGKNIGILGVIEEGVNSPLNFAVVGENFATGNGTASSYNTGLYGAAENNANDNYAIDGTSNSPVGNSYGTTGWTFGTSGTNYAIYGQCGSNAVTNYAGFFNGDVNITGTLTTPSDENLKANINDITSVLGNLKKLVIKEYEFKSDLGVQFPKGKQFGFIAQNVATIYPNLVKQEVAPTYEFIKSKDKEGKEIFTKNRTGELKYNSVNYLGFIPLLTEGIKEQQTQIDLLEKESKELRLMVEQLIKDNQALTLLIESK